MAKSTMRNWFRSPTLLKLFVGQHIVNGLTVAISVVAVALAAAVAFGLSAGQAATLGAISASISDFPASWRAKARILVVGFGFALLATSFMQLARGSALTEVAAVGLIAFAAGMVTGYGRWALSLSAQFLVPMVLVLGMPRADPATTLHVEELFALGGFAYIALTLAASHLMGAGERRLMASECFRELATYLRVIARFTDPEIDLNEVYGGAIRQQAALAEQLQAARAILLDHPRETSKRVRLAATIGLLLDVFDALVAAQSDLVSLRDIPAAETLLTRVGVAIRAAALDLQHLSLELLTTTNPGLPPGHEVATNAMRREAARLVAAGEVTGADAVVVEATTGRLLYARENIRRLEHALCDDAAARVAIGEVDLSAFEPRRSYDPRVLAQHLTMSSPVFRFALRLSAAMMAGALIAVSLGWVAHGNWVLLTTAVIMRASYGWTRKRRDDRIVGTLIGCVIASVAVPLLGIVGLVVLLGFAVALTQGFVRSNYRVASVGASVVALIALHLSDPAVTAPVLTRLADTLIGAAIAHLFSHVLPLWELTEAPNLVARLLSQIGGFAEVALQPDARDQSYRLARRDIIEALAALSDSAARMGGEPRATRRGLDEMASMLIAAYVVVAHISALRLAMRARDGKAAEQAMAARRWLVATLAAYDANDPPILAGEVRPPPALLKAALTFLAAARAYRRISPRA